MNKTILIGRLTKDVDLKFAKGDGKAVSRFTLAVPNPFKKDETNFINCVAFGKQAETLAEYTQKGHRLGVTGSIKTGKYEKDGVTRYTTDIIVENFDFIQDKQSNGLKELVELGVLSDKQVKTLEKKREKAIMDKKETGFDNDITPVDDGDMPF